jgi:hypothetical protein
MRYYKIRYQYTGFIFYIIGKLFTYKELTIQERREKIIRNFSVPKITLFEKSIFLFCSLCVLFMIIITISSLLLGHQPHIDIQLR